MSLNFNTKQTWIYSDNYDMLLEHNYDWDTYGNNDITDCVGLNAMAYLAYEDKRLLDAIKKCYAYKKDSKGEYIEPFRHPSFINKKDYINDMSRDHVIYTIGIMNYAGENLFVKELSKKLRFKFNSKFSMTIDMWLWLKGISGNYLAMILFYIIEIPLMIFSLTYNEILFKISKIGPELSQDDYKQISQESKPKIQQKILKIYYPFYAFCFSVFMNFTTKNNLGKLILNKIYSLFIPKYNMYLKLLTNNEVSSNDVYSYKSMTGTRWTTILNNVNDRDVRIITDPIYLTDNVIDVDIIRNLYNKIK